MSYVKWLGRMSEFLLGVGPFWEGGTERGVVGVIKACLDVGEVQSQIDRLSSTCSYSVITGGRV